MKFDMDVVCDLVEKVCAEYAGVNIDNRKALSDSIENAGYAIGEAVAKSIVDAAYILNASVLEAAEKLRR